MPGNRLRRGLWIGVFAVFVLLAPAVVRAGNARVAALSATRGNIRTASNPSGKRVQVTLGAEVAKSAKNPAGITVTIGVLSTNAKRNAADPKLWCLYE